MTSIGETSEIFHDTHIERVYVTIGVGSLACSNIMSRIAFAELTNARLPGLQRVLGMSLGKKLPRQ